MKLVKFPRTPHLFILPGLNIRGDKVVETAELADFLKNRLTIEEKVDGTNIGISMQGEKLMLQNRGNFLIEGETGKYGPLWEWTNSRLPELRKTLKNKYIIFGEWCYFKHSIQYLNLPDWFIGFDVFDTESSKFVNVSKRNEILGLVKIEQIPIIKRAVTSEFELKNIINAQISSFYGGPVEGIYIRWEVGEWLFKRAKVVRTDFVENIKEHWSTAKLIKNRVSSTHFN